MDLLGNALGYALSGLKCVWTQINDEKASSSGDVSNLIFPSHVHLRADIRVAWPLGRHAIDRMAPFRVHASR